MNIVVELDGGQHFEQVRNWKSPEETQERDVHKMKLCLEHNISIIRLLQEDVYHDRINWKELLAKELKIRSSPIVIYIGGNKEYQYHKELMK